MKRVWCGIVVCLALAFPAFASAQGSAANAYIDMDSWVYPALEQLHAKGLIPDADLGLRPWRRADCARFTAEAQSRLNLGDPQQDLQQTVVALQQVCATPQDRYAFHLEEIRQTIAPVAGTPLNDGYHFAQTIVNQNGRTYAQGVNLFTDAMLSANAGPFTAFVQAELQRVPFANDLRTASVNNAIATVDFTPQAQAGPHTGYLRGRILQAYVAATFHGNQISLGRQSLWWGPARSGATLFSTNAEPIDMLRYDRTDPFQLPLPLRWLGGVRVQAMVGRLSGTQFVHANHTTFGAPGKALSDQPFIHAEKIAFHPRPSFEFSLSRSVLFAGAGAPLTTSSFARSYFSSGTGNENSDPGDRRIAFDATWRIPHLHQCVTAYVDTFTDDEPFPLAYVKESAWITGFYLTCIPHAKHLSLRAEGLVSPHRDILPGFYYFNVHYLSGYTQQRQLIGSWIGREGKGTQVWTTWTPSPATTLEASVRAMVVDREFLQGGSLQDGSLTFQHAISPQLRWTAQVQAERWNFPLLSDHAHGNVVFTGGIAYRPCVHQTACDE